MGVGSIILEILNYFKDQFTNDRLFLLIIVILIFLFLLLVYLVKPILLSCIDWHYINILHKREIEKSADDKKYVADKTNEIIKLPIDRMIKREEKQIDNENEIKDFVSKSNKE